MSQNEIIYSNVHVKYRKTILFLLLCFAFCYFLTPLPADNVLSRANLTASIVSENNLNINEYHKNTLDKSLLNGNYYSDKAPGISFISVPIAFIYSKFRAPDPGNDFFIQIITIFAVSLPVAFSLMVFFNIIYKTTQNLDTAIIMVLSLSFATLLFPYSTMLYGHAAGASISLIVFYIVFFAELTPIAITMAGLLSGWLAGTEYPLATHSIFFAFLMLYKIEDKRFFGWFILGAIPAISIFMLYNYQCFGSPFSIGYMHENWEPFKTGMSGGIAGVTYPSLNSLFKILLSPGRGLFIVSPVLLLSIPGFVEGVKSRTNKTIAISAGILALMSILINSSQYLPLGGMAPGPRHLVPIIPYLCLLASFSLKNNFIRSRLFPFLIGYSVLSNLIFTIVEPHVHEIFDSTLFEFYLPTIREGVFRISFLGALVPSLTIVSALFYILTISVISFYLVRNKFYFLRYVSIALLGVLFFTSLQYAYYKSSYSRELSNKSFTLASTWEHLNFPESASMEYNKAIVEDPNNYMALFSLGVINFRDKNIPAAEKRFREALTVNPGFSQAHYNLALILSMKNQLDEAIKHYMLAIETDSYEDMERRASSYASIAMIYYNNGDFDEGLKYLALAKQTGSRNTFIQRVESYFKKNNKGSN